MLSFINKMTEKVMRIYKIYHIYHGLSVYMHNINLHGELEVFAEISPKGCRPLGDISAKTSLSPVLYYAYRPPDYDTYYTYTLKLEISESTNAPAVSTSTTVTS